MSSFSMHRVSVGPVGVAGMIDIFERSQKLSLQKREKEEVGGKERKGIAEEALVLEDSSSSSRGNSFSASQLPIQPQTASQRSAQN